MPLSVELNEVSDPDLARTVVETVRDCIDKSQLREEWKLWIRTADGFCQVNVQGLRQTRSRFFFDTPLALTEKIRDWLASYPLR